MVLMSPVTPAPDEGSNPAIVRTIGGACAIDAIYRKPCGLQISLQRLEPGLPGFEAWVPYRPIAEIKTNPRNLLSSWMIVQTIA